MTTPDQPQRNYCRLAHAILSHARIDARDAYEDAEEARQSWGCVVADYVLMDDDRGAQTAATYYREARTESNRRREAWFDASDAVRALTGKPLIKRLSQR